ncbi:MAG: serine--tRNA ligase [Patescibacteria group bacterium]
MIDIKFLRENPQKVREGVRKKHVDVDIDKVLALDQEKRRYQQTLEDLRSRQKKLSFETPLPIKKMTGLKNDIKKIEPRFKEKEEELKKLLLKIPNLPFNDVPEGRDERDNKVLREWGRIPKFDFKVKDHLELGENLNILDTKKASEISGSRFGYLKGAAVLLEIALIRYSLDVLTDNGIIKKIADSIEKGYSASPFIPVLPPMMIKPDVFRKMGRLTDADRDERYHLEKDDLYLVGSAEHTLGPLHMNETIAEKDLPIRYIGFSSCFRREAGSYGKDTKGFLRMHQFDKLEMESFTSPENSFKEQEFIVSLQEYLVQSLRIPYRVVIICSGDMGIPDARQIDIECWIPSQDRYRETHTSDLMTDYQAGRLNTKIRRPNGRTELAHMNDATAFAIGRTLIAIMENYQQKDGSIKIPEVLQKYMGRRKTIRR